MKLPISTSLFGERLREERKRFAITQADAALLCGVTREQWGRYERGAIPSAEVLIHLLGHGFDVNYVLGGSRTVSEEAQPVSPADTPLDSSLLAECMAAVTESLEHRGLTLPSKALAELVALIYEQEAAPGAKGDVKATTARVLRLVKSA